MFLCATAHLWLNTIRNAETHTTWNMAEITVETTAYSKLLLHAAKYPHCAVNGILLAEDNKQSKDKSRLRFVDCIPLFHLSLNLAPMLEVALLQVTLEWK